MTTQTRSTTNALVNTEVLDGDVESFAAAGVLDPAVVASTSSATPTTYRMSVLGTGYLGATHAVCMAVLGHDVVGVDVDPAKVAKLNEGVVPFFEPGLEPLLQAALASGRLRFTTDFEDAGTFGQVHFLCVGTPQKKDSTAADMTYVEAAISALAPHLSGPTLVVGKSTVPVGTGARVKEILDALTTEAADVKLAWNPEFLREGFAVDDTLHPDRLVFGIDDEWSEGVLRDVYAAPISEGTPVVAMDIPTSELVKVAANSFLATKISYINAMAEVCEAAGADVTRLRDALSYDTRIGGRFLQPGLGFGGGCLPKDIRAFQARATELGVGRAVAFLGEVDAINTRRRERVLEIVREQVGQDLRGVVVAALGATFKPNSDDIRDAPALDVVKRLLAAGAIVRLYDPQGLSNARKVVPAATFTSSSLEAVQGADVVVLLTEWQEFKDLDPAVLISGTSRPNVVDTRHALNADDFKASGWNYRALGRL
jgi:UDPglucose 6-dehydrogenase